MILLINAWEPAHSRIPFSNPSNASFSNNQVWVCNSNNPKFLFMNIHVKAKRWSIPIWVSQKYWQINTEKKTNYTTGRYYSFWWLWIHQGLCKIFVVPCFSNFFKVKSRADTEKKLKKSKYCCMYIVVHCTQLSI